ncbi:MAG: DEAD/DEAH box helicase [Planctomyces sp.]|nr:DEAD/DEAH box helicase [Planctomyces sp.]
MSLAHVLQAKFRGDVRFRGQAYLQAERVSVTRVTPDHLYAVVRDGVEYQTQLSRLNGDLKMFCTCVGEGQTRDPACKHLWATVLAVDTGSYLSSPPRQGHIPAFAAEPVGSLVHSSVFDEDEELGGDVYTPRERRASAASAPAVAAKVRAPRRDWEQKLDVIKERHDPAATGRTTEEREQEIFFEIDLAESRQSRRLVLQTSQRQRRANGQWGKLKPLKLRPGKLDDIEHADDRRVLAYLAGGTPERTNWYAQQAEFQTSVFRYHVPYELALLLMPMMCATGRVRVMGDSENLGKVIGWDGGSPWSLCLVLRADAEEQWHLRGELRRETQSSPLETAELLLPGGLALVNDKLSTFDDFGAFEWIETVNQENGLQVADGEQQELVDRLLDMPALPVLDLPAELRLSEVRCRPSPSVWLKSPKVKGWKHDRLQGSVLFDYDGATVSGSSTQWAIVQREQGRCLLRDREFESASWTQLQASGFRRLLDRLRGDADIEIAISDLGNAVRKLVADGWQVRADGNPVRQPGPMAFRVTAGVDWFELSAKIDFDGRTAAFPELLSALARGDNTIRLDDGSLGILPEEWLKQYGWLSSLTSAEDEGLRFSASQVGLIDALLASESDVQTDALYNEVRDRLQNFAGIESIPEPDGFHGSLRPYQREGVGWLRFLQEFRFGGCLADDMGLGKTVQLLALLLERRRTAAERLPSLVVVPKSLLFNWIQEIQRFTPELTHLEYTGLDRGEMRERLTEYDVILTTYGTLRRDIAILKDIRFDYAVLDEAQTIKNSSSQVAKASRLVHAQHRLALSGTPIENHLGDLWSIFEFLNPGMLGRSSAFKLQTSDAADEQSRRVLSRGLKPFVLRRTKQQVAAELPEKMEETIFCTMGKRQSRLYTELREHYRNSLLGLVREQGLGKSKMHVLEALLRLRQAACHPSLLDRESAEEPFAKLDVLVPHLEELIEEGHKSLVFSQFTSMLAIVRQHLDRKGIRYAYLDGQTKKRKQVVEEFQNDPHCPVFLISLKAGGLGLNLTAAEYVFLLDPWWNPAVEAQAIDRAHRVGQTKQVFAYRLICRDTVEEKILELQKKKRELADAILEADGGLLKDLTAEDLELLLS